MVEVEITLDSVVVSCEDVKKAMEYYKETKELIEYGIVEDYEGHGPPIDLDRVLVYDGERLSICEPDCDDDFEDCDEINVELWDGPWSCFHNEKLDKLLENCMKEKR